MSGYRKVLGKEGEDQAAAFYKKQGCEILARNYQIRGGEIDLIIKDKEEIVFCEVKTRSGNSYGLPQDAVNYFKKKHMINTARCFLAQKGYEDLPARFDVVEVNVKSGKWFTRYEINHIKDAFYCDDV